MYQLHRKHQINTNTYFTPHTTGYASTLAQINRLLLSAISYCRMCNHKKINYCFLILYIIYWRKIFVIFDSCWINVRTYLVCWWGEFLMNPWSVIWVIVFRQVQLITRHKAQVIITIDNLQLITGRSGYPAVSLDVILNSSKNIYRFEISLYYLTNK